MTPTADFGITNKSLTKLLDWFANNPSIECAIIYGSRAMGNHKPGSDMDLTLKGENLDLDRLIRFQSEIENLNIPYMVDLSIFSAINDPSLIDHITRVGREFYRRL